MRNLKTYLSLLLLGAAALTSCQDDFDSPAIETPVAGWLADTDTYTRVTIADVKNEYWKSGDNYYSTIGNAADGKRMLLEATVISSDASGNIYKSLVVQDATGALAMSINANSMNVKYRRGQRLVLDLTDMIIGKYSGLQQLGFPEESAQYGQQTTFMPYEFFEKHVQMDGLPNLELVDTIVATGKDITGGGDEVLRKWQSQLVRFNNCSFVEGGKEPFGIQKENTNRVLTLEDGTQVNVRTSGYSNFYTNILPSGNGDVVGILGYYAGSSDTGNQWQLTLIDANGCMNFGNPTVGPGAESNPYKIDEAIAIMAGGGSATQVWTTGYIVGAVAPGVADVTKNEDIQFTDSPELDNTLVIAQSPDCKDWTKCIVLSLPQGSALRQYGNLADNKDNYRKQIWILGNFGTQLGTYGITGNNGSASTFRIDGVTIPDEPGPGPSTDGDGSEEKPYSVTQVLALGSPGTTAWIKGYIVGSAADKTADSFTTATGDAASNTNLFIAETPGETDYKKCIPVQLPISMRDALSLQKNPGNLGKELTINGSLEKYFGLPGLKNPTDYKLDGQGSGGDTPTPPVVGDGDGSKGSPYSAAQVLALGNPGTAAWVKGYIVGSAPGMSADTFTTETGEAASNTNLFIADTPNETDYTKCVPVQLPASMRDALSLQKNPGNRGKILTISGNLEKYFGMPGVKSPTEYTIDGAGTGGGDTPTPPIVGGGDGSENNPYDVTTAIFLNNPGTTAWVKGYIVGTAPGKSADTFTTATGEAASNTNLFIADTPGETDYTNCLPVQLPTGLRDDLSLQKNPGNLGKELWISGNLEKYFGMPGLKSPTVWKFK